MRGVGVIQRVHPPSNARAPFVRNVINIDHRRSHQDEQFMARRCRTELFSRAELRAARVEPPVRGAIVAAYLCRHPCRPFQRRRLSGQLK